MSTALPPAILFIPKILLFHALLFAILLSIYVRGQELGLKIFAYIDERLQRNRHKKRINATLQYYREYAKKLKLRNVLLPLAITLLVAYVFYAKLIFFAIITSSSMEPTFSKGDLVLMQNILVKPEVGDIILFPDPYTLGSRPVAIAHRVVEVKGGSVITKGDSNPAPDPWIIHRNEILGKAVLLNRKPVVLEGVGRYFLRDFRTKYKYSAEFLAIAKTIQKLKAMGIIVFFVCIVAYLLLSVNSHKKHHGYVPSALFKTESGIKNNENFAKVKPHPEKSVRKLSPGEYMVVVSMVIASLYLIVKSFFHLIYNIVASFEPLDFITNLFYLILGIGVMAGVFLILKKETHLESIADEIFDKVLYTRLEPVLRDVAEVQMELSDIHKKLEMMNLNIEKIRSTRQTQNLSARNTLQTSIIQTSMKYVVLINITLGAFLFMLRYPLEYIWYSITVLYIIWWAGITHEFRLWDKESVWIWVFIPVLTLPVYTIIMDYYLQDYQMFGLLFIGLTFYVLLYYSYCLYIVRGRLPLDLHIAIQEFRNRLKEKVHRNRKKIYALPFHVSSYQMGIYMMIISIALFTLSWLGFSIQHGLINVTWEMLGMQTFTWKSLYSYTLVIVGMIFLVLGFIMVLKNRRG